MTSRLLITGSRDWADFDLMRSVFVEELEWLDAGVVLVHGDAHGADKMSAAVWVQLGRDRSLVDAHPANWKLLGKRAGFDRNAEMVSLGAVLCLAFLSPCRKVGCTRGGPVHPSHGTESTIDMCVQAGIPVRVVLDAETCPRPGWLRRPDGSLAG